MLNFEKPFTFDRVMRIFFSIAVLVVIFFVLKTLSNVLLPFFIAWLLAYLMYPAVIFVQHKMRFKFRSLSIFATLLGVTAIVGGLSWLIIPSVIADIQKLIEIITDLIVYFDTNYNEIIPQQWMENIDAFIASLGLEQLSEPQHIWNVIQKFSPQMWNIVSSTWTFIVGIFVFFIIFLYWFFILLDYETLSEGWKNLIPNRYRSFTLNLAQDVEKSMNNYFRSQALIAFIVGILFCIGFKIIGLPSAILMGITLGVLNLVPYLQTVGILPCIILAIIKASECQQNILWVLFLILLVFLVVQAIQDMLLTPKIMGKAMRLNPAVILLSLSIFGYLLGFIGMIIALPVTTLIISYYKQFVLDENKKDIL
ncbi:MAG: AI-2E family transporter [Paludibacteraceae bacterium]|nr:AI-2E family transporter [Paludibacteraceae bacterium]